MSLCKRFASIIPQNNTVSVTVPLEISLKQQSCIDHPIATKSNYNHCDHQLASTDSKSVSKSLIGKTIATPIRFILCRIFTSKSTRLDDDETDWAEFRSELESCAIFGAKSLHKRSQNPNVERETAVALRWVYFLVRRAILSIELLYVFMSKILKRKCPPNSSKNIRVLFLKKVKNITFLTNFSFKKGQG